MIPHHWPTLRSSTYLGNYVKYWLLGNGVQLSIHKFHYQELSETELLCLHCETDIRNVSGSVAEYYYNFV